MSIQLHIPMELILSSMSLTVKMVFKVYKVNLVKMVIHQLLKLEKMATGLLMVLIPELEPKVHKVSLVKMVNLPMISQLNMATQELWKNG